MPCHSYTIDLLGSYDTTWTKATLIEFMQGKWILDTVVLNTPDPIPDPDSMYVPPNFYVEFLDTIAVIYDLDGHFQAKAPLRITQGQFSEGYYFSSPDIRVRDFDPWYAYLLRLIIPCNDQLVFASSYVDGGDLNYRPYQE